MTRHPRPLRFALTMLLMLVALAILALALAPGATEAGQCQHDLRPMPAPRMPCHL
ncbi:hypothetical protein [Gemmobacter denitrificans]|uniref:Uncharacterized protein n=1 Tax=Gemmobacter denitrificans TaxID=3123040 RepID=A0ABU8BSS9_9RHOB